MKARFSTSHLTGWETKEITKELLLTHCVSPFVYNTRKQRNITDTTEGIYIDFENDKMYFIELIQKLAKLGVEFWTFKSPGQYKLKTKDPENYARRRIIVHSQKLSYSKKIRDKQINYFFKILDYNIEHLDSTAFDLARYFAPPVITSVRLPVLTPGQGIDKKTAELSYYHKPGKRFTFNSLDINKELRAFEASRNSHLIEFKRQYLREKIRLENSISNSRNQASSHQIKEVFDQSPLGPLLSKLGFIKVNDSTWTYPGASGPPGIRIHPENYCTCFHSNSPLENRPYGPSDLYMVINNWSLDKNSLDWKRFYESVPAQQIKAQLEQRMKGNK